MRLGAYPCVLEDGSRVQRTYGRKRIAERHRHRYEFNKAYRSQLVSHGLVTCGLSPDGALVEAVELRDHPWFVGCQFHPEFRSRPFECHPLFKGFVRAALQRRCATATGDLLAPLRAAGPRGKVGAR